MIQDIDTHLNFPIPGTLIELIIMIFSGHQSYMGLSKEPLASFADVGSLD